MPNPCGVAHRDEHDRYRPGGLRRRDRCLGAAREQEIRLEGDELGGQRRQPVQLAVGEAIVDDEIAPRAVAELLERSEERRPDRRVGAGRARTEKSQAIGPLLSAPPFDQEQRRRADEDRPA
jgi:hypothetical protein